MVNSQFFLAVHQLTHFSDIDIHGAMLNTTTTTHAGDAVAILVHIIFQLVHKPLANPLKFFVPRVMAGPVVGKKGKHAAIPVSQPVTLFPEDLILDVKAPACGAEVGTCSAVDA